MRSPISVELNCREDLLLWADLWADWDFPLHSLAAQILHKEVRWPGKHEDGFFWIVMAYNEDSKQRSRLIPRLYGMSTSATTNQKRVYLNRTLAFLDVVNHMAAVFNQDQLEKRITNK